MSSADATPPSAVGGLGGTAGDSQATLTWTDPADVDLNHIEITHNQGGTVPMVVSPGAGSAVFIGLSNGLSYTFTVKAVDGAGNRSAGSPISVTPVSAADVAAPGNVGTLGGTAGDGQATLTWTDPADADLNHIEITHNRTGGTSPIVVDTGTETAVLIMLTNGLSYTFTVKAVDIAGNKSTGSTVSVTPASSADVTLPAAVGTLDGTARGTPK